MCGNDQVISVLLIICLFMFVDNPIINTLLKQMVSEYPEDRPSADEALATLRSKGFTSKTVTTTNTSVVSFRKRKIGQKIHDGDKKENTRPRTTAC